jgi:hypothetical protein
MPARLGKCAVLSTRFGQAAMDALQLQVCLGASGIGTTQLPFHVFLATSIHLARVAG